MIGGLWWSLCCDILWFHGAVAGMFETVCCGTMVSAERTACWGLQTVQHSSDVFVAHWGLQNVWHDGDCKVHCIVVIAKFIGLWWLSNLWHDGDCKFHYSCDCKVHCSVVLIKFMAWWWLQSSLHSKFGTCWWLQGVLCVGGCKTFDKPVIAKCVTYWWLQNVWPTSLGKSLLQEAAERIWHFRIVVSD